MALRFRATALERELTSRVPLELIESATPAHLDQPATAHECPSADDLLDFCNGNLGGARTIALQHHLDLCPACLDVVTLALNDWEPHAPAEWLDVAPNFRCGERIDGRYEITRFIASGGMGEVYEAVDLASGERVALKAVLAAASDNRDMLRAFRREARLARRVRHRNVCHVHDVPAAGDGVPQPLVPYYIMELVEGETLQELTTRGPVPIARALEIARQLLRGIQAIHRAGVLHLDIKSNNIMLRRHSEWPEVVLLDFGLARRAQRRVRGDRALPSIGNSLTIPPEELPGSAPSVQNDIFAFGIVLYQMLTGRLPAVRTKDPARSSAAECAGLDAHTPGESISALPQWLDEVLRRCLAQRTDRYRDVAAVLGALAHPSTCQ